MLKKSQSLVPNHANVYFIGPCDPSIKVTTDVFDRCWLNTVTGQLYCETTMVWCTVNPFTSEIYLIKRIRYIMGVD